MLKYLKILGVLLYVTAADLCIREEPVDSCIVTCQRIGVEIVFYQNSYLKIAIKDGKSESLFIGDCGKKRMRYTKSDFSLIFSPTTLLGKSNNVAIIFQKVVDSLSDLEMVLDGSCITRGLITLPKWSYCTTIRHEYNPNALETFLRNEQINNNDPVGLNDNFIDYYENLRNDIIRRNLEKDTIKMLNTLLKPKFCWSDRNQPADLQHLNEEEKPVLRIYLSSEKSNNACKHYSTSWHKYNDSLLIHPIAKENTAGIEWRDYVPLIDLGECKLTFIDDENTITCNMEGLDRVLLHKEHIYAFYHSDKGKSIEKINLRGLSNLFKNWERKENKIVFHAYKREATGSDVKLIFDRFVAALTNFDISNCVTNGIFDIKHIFLGFCTEVSAGAKSFYLGVPAYQDYHAAYYGDKVKEYKWVDLYIELNDFIKYLNEVKLQNFVMEYHINYINGLTKLRNDVFNFCKIEYNLQDDYYAVKQYSKFLRFYLIRDVADMEIPRICMNYRYKTFGSHVFSLSADESSDKLIYINDSLNFPGCVVDTCSIKCTRQYLKSVFMSQINDEYVFHIVFEILQLELKLPNECKDVISLDLAADFAGNLFKKAVISPGLLYDRFIASLTDMDFTGCVSYGLLELLEPFEGCASPTYDQSKSDAFKRIRFVDYEISFYGSLKIKEFKFYISQILTDLEHELKHNKRSRLKVVYSDLHLKLKEVAMTLNDLDTVCKKLQGLQCSVSCIRNGLDMIWFDPEKNELLVTIGSRTETVRINNCYQKLAYHKTDNNIDIFPLRLVLTERDKVLLFHRAIDSLSDLELQRDGTCITNGLVHVLSYGQCTGIYHKRSRYVLERFIINEAAYYGHVDSQIKDFMGYLQDFKNSYTAIALKENIYASFLPSSGILMEATSGYRALESELLEQYMLMYAPKCRKTSNVCEVICPREGLSKIIREEDFLIVVWSNNIEENVIITECEKEMIYNKTISDITIKQTENNVSNKSVLIFYRILDLLTNLIMHEDGNCTTRGLVSINSFGSCNQIKHEKDENAIEEFIKNAAISKSKVSLGIESFMLYYNEVKNEIEALKHKEDKDKYEVDIYMQLLPLLNTNFCGCGMKLSVRYLEYVNIKNVLRIKYYLSDEYVVYECQGYEINWYIYQNIILLHPVILKYHKLVSLTVLDYSPTFSNILCRVVPIVPSGVTTDVFADCDAEGLDLLIWKLTYVYVFYSKSNDYIIERIPLKDDENKLDWRKRGKKIELIITGEYGELDKMILYDRFIAALTKPDVENCTSEGLYTLNNIKWQLGFCDDIVYTATDFANGIAAYNDYCLAYYGDRYKEQNISPYFDLFYDELKNYIAYLESILISNQNYYKVLLLLKRQIAFCDIEVQLGYNVIGIQQVMNKIIVYRDYVTENYDIPSGCEKFKYSGTLSVFVKTFDSSRISYKFELPQGISNCQFEKCNIKCIGGSDNQNNTNLVAAIQLWKKKLILYRNTPYSATVDIPKGCDKMHFIHDFWYLQPSEETYENQINNIYKT